MAVDTIDNNAAGADALSSVDYIPPWLNNGFLQNYLQTFFENRAIQVIESDAKLATAKGDNYASCIFRVKLSFNTNQVSVSRTSFLHQGRFYLNRAKFPYVLSIFIYFVICNHFLPHFSY